VVEPAVESTPEPVTPVEAVNEVSALEFEEGNEVDAPVESAGLIEESGESVEVPTISEPPMETETGAVPLQIVEEGVPEVRIITNTCIGRVSTLGVTFFCQSTIRTVSPSALDHICLK